jgi:hypothetical protein
MPFTYSPDTGRYRDQVTGRLVPESAIRAAVDTVADAASEQLSRLTARLRAGELLVSEWEIEAIRVTKQAHIAAGLAAHGGRAQMTPATWGYLGSRLRSEYGYLRTFANQVAEGLVPDDGTLEARAALYGQAARVTYEAVQARDATDRGFDEERNVLHASESCAGCQAQSALGWVALGTLSPIGSRDCLSRCRCTVSRRRSTQGRAHLRAVS